MATNNEFKITFTKEFRSKLYCKACAMFPRPQMELFRCTSCKELLCDNCCRHHHPVLQCPICKYESRDKQISTFIRQSELMEVLSGFQTHPCIYLKNGCNEEIPAVDKKLRAHSQKCVFQMVQCPKMNCEESFLFKDLGMLHLKLDHIDDIISISHNDVSDRVRSIFGHYYLQHELVNNRKCYENELFSLSWNSASTSWNITGIGSGRTYALLKKDVENLHDSTDWELFWEKDGWKKAGDALKIKGNFILDYYFLASTVCN